VDKVDRLVEDIRTELNRLTSGAWPESRWAYGKLKKDEHAKLPRIEWEEAGGAIALGKLVGGNTGNIAADAEQFVVTIWNSSRETCRNTLHNLIIAARNEAFGPNVKWGAYDWDEPAHLNSGRKLKIAVTFTVPVDTEAHPEATIETQDHEIKVGTEVIC
jgi:hypothetical protein